MKLILRANDVIVALGFPKRTDPPDQFVRFLRSETLERMHNRIERRLTTLKS